MTVPMWGLAALVGLLSIAAQILMTVALHKEDAGMVMPFKYLGAVMALSAGWILYGETMSLLSLLGMGLVVVCIATNTWSNRSRVRRLPDSQSHTKAEARRRPVVANARTVHGAGWGTRHMSKATPNPIKAPNARQSRLARGAIDRQKDGGHSKPSACPPSRATWACHGNWVKNRWRASGSRDLGLDTSGAIQSCAFWPSHHRIRRNQAHEAIHPSDFIQVMIGAVG